MATRTYLDLTVERRKVAAQSIHERQLAILADPFTSLEAKAAAREVLAKIKDWEDGTVPVGKRT